MISLLPKHIQDFISSSPTVSLGPLKYKSVSGNGGCKELLINNNIVSIVVPCGTRKLETSHRFRVILYISQETYESLILLVEYVSNSLGTNVRPFCWSHSRDRNTETDYYIGAKIRTSKSGDMYTRLYTNNGKELNKEEWPTSFEGHVCINLEGIYISDMKSRSAELSFVTTVDEILVSELTNLDRGSKIRSVLIDIENDTDTDIDDMW